MVKKMGKNKVTAIKAKAGKITFEQKINIYDGDIKSQEAIDEVATAVVEKFGKAGGQELTVELGNYKASYTIGNDLREMIVADLLDC